jgi:hypothetical protein
MIPKDIDNHAPQLLIKLLTNPPGSHGGYLKGEEAEAYRFLVDHKYLTQIRSQSKRSSGKRVAITTTLDHKVEKSADKLRHLLEERLGEL